MKKVVLTVSCLVVWMFNIQAQSHNPFEKFGYTPKIATFSGGKYNEFHDLDSIVQIGRAYLNVNTRQIVGFVEKKEAESEDEYRPDADLVSRWLSPDPLAEVFWSISPYAYCVNNPVMYTDPTGMYIVGTDGKPVTYSIEEGKVVWSSNVTTDVERVGNAMLKTETGGEQLDFLINHEAAISIEISSEIKRDKNGILIAGDTKSGDLSIKGGEASTSEFTITIFEGSLIENKKMGSQGDRRYSGRSIDDAIGSVAVHESVHTEKENLQQVYENTHRGAKHDTEKKPNTVERQHLKELDKNNKNNRKRK